MWHVSIINKIKSKVSGIKIVNVEGHENIGGYQSHEVENKSRWFRHRHKQEHDIRIQMLE